MVVGDFDQALNDAARSAVENGIPVVVAAGNYGVGSTFFPKTRLSLIRPSRKTP